MAILLEIAEIAILVLVSGLGLGLLFAILYCIFDFEENIPLIKYCIEMSSLECYKRWARLDFDRFKAFYYANPSAWTLNDFHVQRYDSDSPVGYICFCFDYTDWRKYCKFLKKLEKEKEQTHERQLEKNRDKDLLRLTELVQKDIDRLNKKAEEERKSAEKVVVRVAENLTDRQDGVLTKAAKNSTTHTAYKTYDEILEVIHDNISKWG